MGIFPAGEVLTLNIIKQEITDKKWDNSILKFIKMANVPVVPMPFSGSNSKLFHTLGLIHPELRTAKLPSELFNKKDKPISVSIGSPITCEEQLVFSNIEQYGRYLRALTYLPNMANNVKKHFYRTLSAQKKVSALAPPVDNAFIKAEIKKYLQINGRILAFNLDPKFNDSLDGFMLLDFNDIPNDFIASLSKELTNIKTNHPIIFPQHKQIV